MSTIVIVGGGLASARLVKAYREHGVELELETRVVRLHVGSFEEGKAIAFYLDGGRIAGALLTGQDEETEARLKELIRAREPLSAYR